MVGHQRDRFPVRQAVPLAGSADALDLTVLRGEALHGGDPAEAGAELCVDSGSFGADLGITRLESFLEAERAPHDYRHGQENEHRDSRRQDDEGGADEGNRQEQLHHVVGAVVENPLELVHVVVEHRHQAPRGAVLEVGELELLDVGVGLDSELVLDRLGEVAPCQLL